MCAQRVRRSLGDPLSRCPLLRQCGDRRVHAAWSDRTAVLEYEDEVREGRNVGAQSEPAASWSAFWRVRWSSRACSTGVVSRIVRRVLPVFNVTDDELRPDPLECSPDLEGATFAVLDGQVAPLRPNSSDRRSPVATARVTRASSRWSLGGTEQCRYFGVVEARRSLCSTCGDSASRATLRTTRPQSSRPAGLTRQFRAALRCALRTPRFEFGEEPVHVLGLKLRERNVP